MNQAYKWALIRKEQEAIERAIEEISIGNYQHYAWAMERAERLGELDPALARELSEALWDAAN